MGGASAPHLAFQPVGGLLRLGLQWGRAQRPTAHGASAPSSPLTQKTQPSHLSCAPYLDGPVLSQLQPGFPPLKDFSVLLSAHPLGQRKFVVPCHTDILVLYREGKGKKKNSYSSGLSQWISWLIQTFLPRKKIQLLRAQEESRAEDWSGAVLGSFGCSLGEMTHSPCPTVPRKSRVCSQDSELWAHPPSARTQDPKTLSRGEEEP